MFMPSNRAEVEEAIDNRIFQNSDRLITGNKANEALKLITDNFANKVNDMVDTLVSTDVNKALSANQGRALNVAKADKVTVTGATKTKVTYNSQGIVTAGADANTDDIQESGTPTNKWWTNARTISSVLTGFTGGAGTVTATDTILTAIQKIVGNIGALVTGVSSVNTLSGAVTLTTANIADSVGKRYQTENQNTFNDATSSIQTQLDSKTSTARNVQSGTTYTLVLSDFVKIVALTNVASRTITVPLANTIPSNGLVCRIKDESGTSSTAPISITLSGADTLEGSSGTFVFINRNSSEIGVYSDGISKYFAI